MHNMYVQLYSTTVQIQKPSSTFSSTVFHLTRNCGLQTAHFPEAPTPPRKTTLSTPTAEDADLTGLHSSGYQFLLDHQALW